MQRSTTKGTDVEHQLSLIPERRNVSRPVNLAHIPLLQNTSDALEYGCQLAGVARKEIYPDMGKDKSTWSRICSGEWDIYGRDIPKLNRILGNSAYTRYLDHLDGVDLLSIRKEQDDKDKEIAELKQRVADLDRAVRLVVGYQRGNT